MTVIDVDASGAEADPHPHNSMKADIIACSVVCVVVATLFTALRFYTRMRIVKVVALTDWFLLAGLVTSWILSAFSILEAHYGLGAHVWDFDVEANFRGLEKAAWLAILFYLVAVHLIKLSFVLLYLQIFSYMRTRIAIYVAMGLVIFAALWSIIITLTACIPLQAFWDPASHPDAYCHPIDFWWANTGLHVATDYFIFAVPLPKIWTMNLPKHQKTVLLTLFSLGFIVCFISIIRVIFLDRLHREQDPDFSYAGTDLTLLSVVEINAAIVVASCLTLKPLVGRWFPEWLRSGAAADAADNGNVLTVEKPTVGPIHTPTTTSTHSRPAASDRASADAALIQHASSSIDAVARKGSQSSSNAASPV